MFYPISNWENQHVLFNHNGDHYGCRRWLRFESLQYWLDFNPQLSAGSLDEKFR